jgi:hypothetical protein
MTFRRVLLTISFLLVLMPVAAQPSPHWPRADRCFYEPSHGNPYSAEFLLTSVQLLPSGDLSRHLSKEFQALDSHGALLPRERFPAEWAAGAESPGIDLGPRLRPGRADADHVEFTGSADDRSPRSGASRTARLLEVG